VRFPSFALLAVAAALSTGCSSLSETFSGSKLDYKTAAQQTKGLEVPPDLTQLAREGRYVPPAGVVSAAQAGTQPGGAPRAAPAGPTVAPAAIGEMRIVRDGDLRMLVVPQTPEQLWPQLRAFWVESGFTLAVDDPVAGVIETEWSENRTKLPQDLLRRTLGRLIDGLYDSGERDRFRMRVERTASGSGSEIVVSHRGLQEVAGGALKDDLRWTPRPADPTLEGEMLTRLMVRLGGAEATARTQLASTATAGPARARSIEGRGTPALEMDEPFDRAWRRVGLALDRTGFTVEDRNRSDGVYYVRYVGAKGQDAGFLQRLFGSEEAGKAQRYRIALLGGSAVTAGRTIVAVQAADGTPANDAAGQRIASVLLEELK
jgi:outer membrane protein assembly factor BamC